MRKTVLIIIGLLLLFMPSLFSGHLSLYVAPWAASPSLVDSTGTHAQLGISYAAAPRLELEAFTVMRLTPDPFSHMKAALAISLPLATDLFMHDGKAPLYYNAYATLGYMMTVKGAPSHTLFLRLTPLSLGGPYYGTRERSLVFALLYDLTNKAFSLSCNLFMFDYYFK